jgi:hypothetical protein
MQMVGATKHLLETICDAKRKTRNDWLAIFALVAF